MTACQTILTVLFYTVGIVVIGFFCLVAFGFIQAMRQARKGGT